VKYSCFIPVQPKNFLTKIKDIFSKITNLPPGFKYNFNSYGILHPPPQWHCRNEKTMSKAIFQVKPTALEVCSQFFNKQKKKRHKKRCWFSQLAPFICHPFIGKGNRREIHSRAIGSFQYKNHNPLFACGA